MFWEGRQKKKRGEKKASRSLRFPGKNTFSELLKEGKRKKKGGAGCSSLKKRREGAAIHDLPASNKGTHPMGKKGRGARLLPDYRTAARREKKRGGKIAEGEKKRRVIRI